MAAAMFVHVLRFKVLHICLLVVMCLILHFLCICLACGVVCMFALVLILALVFVLALVLGDVFDTQHNNIHFFV